MIAVARIWKFLFSFAIFVAVCYGGLVWFVNHEVTKGLEQAVADTPGLTLTYADLSVSISDHSVTLTDIAATLPGGQSLTADTLRITSFDQRNPVPHYASGQATGVVMDTTFANFGTWAAPLRAMGKTTVSGDVSLDYRFDPDTRELTVNALTVSEDELGEVVISATTDQLDLNALRMEKLVGLRITRADLTLTDRSLMERMVRSAARGLSTSEADARASISAELTAMADYAEQDGNPVAEDVLRAIRRFVNEPGTITLSARPAEPVPVLYFFMGRDFYDNLRLLNVSATTDAGDDI